MVILLCVLLSKLLRHKAKVCYGVEEIPAKYLSPSRRSESVDGTNGAQKEGKFVKVHFYETYEGQEKLKQAFVGCRREEDSS